jgi:hypothetical protein
VNASIGREYFDVAWISISHSVTNDLALQAETSMTSDIKKERAMKWLCSVSIGLVAASSIVMAQSDATMGKPAMADSMAMNETYVGCVEAGNAPGSFVLTHVSHEPVHEASMTKDAMHQDAKDTMMKHEGHAGEDMSKPAATSSVMLAGSAVSKKYLGRKVSVSGPVTMASQTSVAVKSIKVIAKACS